MRVWLIRHPAPAVAPGTCYGRLDLGLAESAAIAGTRLSAELPPLGIVVSSPLSRCRQLAECLHPAAEFDERLAEMHFGDWEGRTWDAIGRAALDAWAADPLGHRPPGGESAREMAARVVSFAAEFSSRIKVFRGQPANRARPCEVAIVAHQGPLRVLAAHWQNESESESESTWQHRRFEFGQATPVTIDP